MDRRPSPGISDKRFLHEEMTTARKILCVCGARPNFMKVAPIVRALSERAVEHRLIHTGQHYDERMSRLFFRDLGLPAPHVNLEVGSASHAVQTAQIMIRFEPELLQYDPDWVVVVGDVNSTVACSLVAAKLGVKVAHVEAGLRSFDRTMPEEINRIVTDRISDALFVTEESGVENLRQEGIDEQRIHFVGNVMIDTLMQFRPRADESTILNDLPLNGPYAVVTLHRPSNVDDPVTFGSILKALIRLSDDLPVVFPIHPRSRQAWEASEFCDLLSTAPHFRLIDPLGYFDFLKLMAEASLVLTDSGGIQEETTILNVPCLTLRNNTERPVTITHGTNRLAGTSSESILRAYDDLRRDPPRPIEPPPLWDGRAAGRIVDGLLGLTRTPSTVPTLKGGPARVPLSSPVESCT